jgi:hypothetical protein
MYFFYTTLALQIPDVELNLLSVVRKIIFFSPFVQQRFYLVDMLTFDKTYTCI